MTADKSIQKSSSAANTVAENINVAELPLTIIRPSSGWNQFDYREFWRYKDLLYFFIWRDIKVRYKQTVLGATWAILQPLITMVIFSLFFGRLAQVPSDGVPYPVFSYTALVPWTFFANTLLLASNSLVANAGMVRKVYFPRIVMPMAAVFAGLVDFALAFVVLLGMLLYFRIAPTKNIIWLPYFLLLALITSLGVSLWFSAMNVRFRDIRYAVPFLIQAWLFITPIAYPSSLLPEPWRTLYGLNPMAGVVEGFRWALLGVDTAPGSMLLLSSLVAALALVGGIIYFHRLEKTFADVI